MSVEREEVGRINEELIMKDDCHSLRIHHLVCILNFRKDTFYYRNITLEVYQVYVHEPTKGQKR